MSNFAIRAEGLSKRYRIEAGARIRKPRQQWVSDAIAAAARNLVRGSLGRKAREAAETLWALRDVSFEVRHGDPLGIIGANGAGKTTLLKVLARITAPTEGRARLRGRVGSLLEVGTGFHSELSGRDNVYLNGAVLGMRADEIKRKFDAIVTFSGVEGFIDTPLKFYSSGMRMRLAFSVAAHLEPEILLVDEVLAVGDIAFQNKCLNKMQEVTTEGRTVLFVSHNLGAVRSLCPRSMYLEHGRVQFLGGTTEALEQYLTSRELVVSPESSRAPVSGVSRILNVVACDDEARPTKRFAHDQPIRCRLRVSLRRTGFKPFLTLRVYGPNMETILATHDFEQSGQTLLPDEPGTYEFEVLIPAGLLAPARYYLGADLGRQMRHNQRHMARMEYVGEFDVYDNGSMMARLDVPWQGLVHSQAITWANVTADAAEPASRDDAHS